jgi:LEA14-like dessication related protein
MARMTLLLIFLICLFSCNSPVSPEYKTYKNLKIEKLNLQQSNISLDLVYYNPNRFAIKMKQTELDIYLDGRYLGHSTAPQIIEVPRNADFIVPVKVMVDMGQLLKNSWAALTGKEVTIKVTGNTKIGKAGVYFNFPVFYEGKQTFSLF